MAIEGTTLQLAILRLHMRLEQTCHHLPSVLDSNSIYCPSEHSTLAEIRRTRLWRPLFVRAFRYEVPSVKRAKPPPVSNPKSLYNNVWTEVPVMVPPQEEPKLRSGRHDVGGAGHPSLTSPLGDLHFRFPDTARPVRPRDVKIPSKEPMAGSTVTPRADVLPIKFPVFSEGSSRTTCKSPMKIIGDSRCCAGPHFERAAGRK